MGNRGILHRDGEIVGFHRGDLWITCSLEYRDWRAPQWQPGHYTVLFFHDEAVALAAGHRPCALCRRPAYLAFRNATAGGTTRSPTGAKGLDRLLHAERIVARTHRRRLHERRWQQLPDGAFVLLDDGPALVLGGAVVPWTHSGYSSGRRRPDHGMASSITPPTTLAALAAGYQPQIDITAREFADSTG